VSDRDGQADVSACQSHHSRVATENVDIFADFYLQNGRSMPKLRLGVRHAVCGRHGNIECSLRCLQRQHQSTFAVSEYKSVY
jgi:hypothetical protein